MRGVHFSRSFDLGHHGEALEVLVKSLGGSEMGRSTSGTCQCWLLGWGKRLSISP
jgi:hypothetical protein